MEIRHYIEPLIKWWKLVLVACVLAGISSWLVVRQQPPVYRTSAALVIGKAVYELNPTGGQLGLASQLATYYADIAQRDVVRKATMESLGLNWLPAYTVSALPDSQILEISVSDEDPLRAQAVANELSRQLINQSPSNPDLQEQKHQEFIRGQINLVEGQIQETLDEIAAKEAELGSLNSARQISQTQSEIIALQQKLTTLQSNYTGLLNASSGQGNNSLTLLQPAGLPIRPVGPDRLMVILMSVAIAFLISAGAAYLIEYLDDTFETADEINKHLDLPVIGFIPEFRQVGEEKPSLLVRDARSIEAEAFRALRMNIDFLQVQLPIKSLLVASVGKTEGKSVISSNLAAAIARGGKNVLLLDADMRRPSLHKYVNIPNDVGLSNVFLHEVSLEDVMIKPEIENLRVITTGSTPPNPGELVASSKMDEILRELENQSDVVIVDGPPVLVTDATILSAKVDAVLLVVGANRTRRSDAQIAIKQLERAGARVIGVVMNRVAGSNQSYYQIYQYDYGMESTDENKKGGIQIGRWTVPIGRAMPRRSTKSKLTSDIDRTEPLTEES